MDENRARLVHFTDYLNSVKETQDTTAIAFREAIVGLLLGDQQLADGIVMAVERVVAEQLKPMQESLGFAIDRLNYFLDSVEKPTATPDAISNPQPTGQPAKTLKLVSDLSEEEFEQMVGKLCAWFEYTSGFTTERLVARVKNLKRKYPQQNFEQEAHFQWAIAYYKDYLFGNCQLTSNNITKEMNNEAFELAKAVHYQDMEIEEALSDFQNFIAHANSAQQPEVATPQPALEPAPAPAEPVPEPSPAPVQPEPAQPTSQVDFPTIAEVNKMRAQQLKDTRIALNIEEISGETNKSLRERIIRELEDFQPAE